LPKASTGIGNIKIASGSDHRVPEICGSDHCAAVL
jgi:hypothetical protein